jgi:micrococcal nuclease
MEIIYNLIGLTTFVVFLAFLAGLIKPALLNRFLGARAKRKFILVGGLLLIFVLVTLSSVFEPASLKQARITKDNESKTAEIKSEPKTISENNNTKKQIEDPRYYWHKVTRIVDGDTLKANIDGKEETIRVIGIDTPESTTKIECYGQESTKKANELLQGKWIQVEKDNSQDEKDKYGRLLRFVWIDKSTDYGKKMINDGYAFEYTYNKPYKYQTDYKEAEFSAKNNKRGLWATEKCNGLRVKSVIPQSPPSSSPASVQSPPPYTPISSPPSTCDPNYNPCIPYVEGDGLNCADIKKKVQVIGVDHNKFDRNNDGYGCESYS